MRRSHDKGVELEMNHIRRHHLRFEGYLKIFTQLQRCRTRGRYERLLWPLVHHCLDVARPFSNHLFLGLRVKSRHRMVVVAMGI